MRASVPPGTAVSSARVYFRADGKKDEYYLEMRRSESGAYWAVLPVALGETKNVVYRVAIRDANGAEGSTPAYTIPVLKEARADLTDEEKRFANNLVIGLTVPGQDPLPEGFDCKGVISQITVAGELKPNDACRRVIAAIPPAAAAIAAGVLATGAVVTYSNKGGEPVSPSRPPGVVSPTPAPLPVVRR